MQAAGISRYPLSFCESFHHGCVYITDQEFHHPQSPIPPRDLHQTDVKQEGGGGRQAGNKLWQLQTLTLGNGVQQLTCIFVSKSEVKCEKTARAGRETRIAPKKCRGSQPEISSRRRLVQVITSSRKKAILEHSKAGIQALMAAHLPVPLIYL